ncbi:MAG: hypothetical protein OSJ35_05650 [Alistipes sp.]|nr:hypothetical protein [Alistipes sp.]
MRKILVSGCANCPYLTVWNDGNEEKEPHDRICSGDCRHPSFHKELGFPHFNREVFLPDTEIPTSDTKVRLVDPAGTPDWCPLPKED